MHLSQKLNMFISLVHVFQDISVEKLGFPIETENYAVMEDVRDKLVEFFFFFFLLKADLS